LLKGLISTAKVNKSCQKWNNYVCTVYFSICQHFIYLSASVCIKGNTIFTSLKFQKDWMKILKKQKIWDTYYIFWKPESKNSKYVRSTAFIILFHSCNRGYKFKLYVIIIFYHSLLLFLSLVHYILIFVPILNSR